MTESSRRVVILVGTDHHAFDRLTTWADERQRGHPHDEVFLQFGSSREPEAARGTQFLSSVELRAQVQSADVVITHGGPGTIGDARAAGHMPIVVPRDPGLAEHVDDHQLRFSAWAQNRGLVRRVVDMTALDPLIEELGSPGTRHRFTHGDDVEASVQALQDVITANRDRRGAVHPPRSPLILHLTGLEVLGAASSSLASNPKLVVVGRAGLLWEHGTEVVCSCGAGVQECPFWGDVGRRAFGGWASLDRLGPERRAAPAGSGSARRAAWRHPGRPARARFLAYADHCGRLYRAVFDTAGADAVIETAEDIGPALALSHDRCLDVRVLQVQGAGQPLGPLRVDAWRLRHRSVPNALLPRERAQPDVIESRVAELLAMSGGADRSEGDARGSRSEPHVLEHPKETSV